MLNLKDNVTTILGVLVVVLGIVNAYLQANAGQPINWYQLGTAIVLGVVSFLTGKNPDGSTKVIDPKTGQQDVDPNAVKP